MLLKKTFTKHPQKTLTDSKHRHYHCISEEGRFVCEIVFGKEVLLCATQCLSEQNRMNYTTVNLYKLLPSY